jgi:signal transduction histidine kinase
MSVIGEEGSVRTIRGPFARWPRVSDAVLAAVLFVTTLTVAEGPDETLAVRPASSVPVPVVLVIAIVTAATFLRRRAPLVMLGVAAAGWAVLLPTGEYDIGFTVLVVLYGTGRYVAEPWLGLAGVGVISAVLVAEGLVRSTPWGETAFGVGALSLTWYIGRQLRLREERATLRRRQQVDEARRIVAEERTHIARELHDVVAHQVSMMTVQAGAAQAVAATDPEAARRAMAAVEQAGRQALDELRHLLGVLRPESGANGTGPGTDPEATDPQPGLADLPRLLGQVRAAGLPVDVHDAVRTPLPIRVQLSAYRIIQEALTNVLKHATPGTRAEVHLTEANGTVTIEVLDHANPVSARPGAQPSTASPPANPVPRTSTPPPAASPGAPPTASPAGEAGLRSSAARPRRVAGHGIIGMRERAVLLGGSLDTGPHPDGGFRVVARLPVSGDPA